MCRRTGESQALRTLRAAGLTVKGSILVEGAKLDVGGEASGIWFVPVTESGGLSADEGSWVKVSTRIVYNLPANSSLVLTLCIMSAS